VVATRDPAVDAAPAELSRRFEALFGDPGERPRRLGIEQEYGVFEGDRQIDFGPLVDARGFEGERLHPTNARAYQTPSGLLLMADGVVAEAASPPVLLGAGFVGDLETWGGRGRAAIEDRLDGGLRLIGGSTHVSVEVPHELNEALCEIYAQTFAPALMLLMDRQDSPGLLIRPRPSRTELCGEFVHGERLRAALVFAAGSVLAILAQLEGHQDAPRLPAQLRVLVEPGRQRHGLYVDRTAFGPDLYEQGRGARLQLSDGDAVSAQEHLERCWRAARAALRAAGIDGVDLEAADRVVSGATPLPCEVAELDDAACPQRGLEKCDQACDQQQGAAHAEHPALMPDRHGLVLSPTAPPELDLRPVSATWDFAAFEVTSRADPTRSAVVTVPERQLDQFLDQVGTGAFNEVLGEYLAQPVTNRVLASSGQTTTPGIYDSVEANPQLLPPDLMGVGPGAPSPQRPGKRTEEEPPIEVKVGGFPWVWIGGAIGALAVVAALFLLGGDEGPGVDGATPEPVVATEAPTIAPTLAPTAPPLAATLAPGFVPCNIHPQEEAIGCLPHYTVLSSEAKVPLTPGGPFIFETSYEFRAPVPTDPEYPIEYRYVLEGSNGQRIEHVLTGGPGQPLTCVRTVNGVESAPGPGEVCGQLTAPNRMLFIADVTAFGPGELGWIFSTLETGADGIVRGEYAPNRGDQRFQISDPNQ